jgi:hypothetical protein
LADEEDAPILENRKNDHGSRMHDDIALGLHAARLDHRVALQTENFALIENFAFENFRPLSWQIRPRCFCFMPVALVRRGGRTRAPNSSREVYTS